MLSEVAGLDITYFGKKISLGIRMILFIIQHRFQIKKQKQETK